MRTSPEYTDFLGVVAALHWQVSADPAVVRERIAREAQLVAQGNVEIENLAVAARSAGFNNRDMVGPLLAFRARYAGQAWFAPLIIEIDVFLGIMDPQFALGEVAGFLRT